MTTCLRQLLFILLLALPAIPAFADADWRERPWLNPDGQIQLYFFWSRTCPHCLEARPHVEAIAAERPWLRLHSLELTRQPENARRYLELAQAVGGEANAVPALLFCGEMHVGWDAGSAALLGQRLDACRVRVLAGEAIVAPDIANRPIPLPLFGSLNPDVLSLPTLTIVLAGLDAFNPCAFFVLLFLLSMLTHQKSRRRMLAIGGVFVAISGLMYFAFMAAWLSVFELFSHLGWMTAAAGAVAVLVGALNVKDFFRFGQGPSLSITEAHKASIFQRARAILNAERLPAMLAATAFLAVAANFYELLCTAGFPMVYTRLLTLHELTPAARYGYLVLYNLIYVLPLGLIVLAFARTLGARRLSEREGRLLKLLSGAMMLQLGLLLLTAPALISQPGVAFALMLVAIGLTALAARLTRRA